MKLENFKDIPIGIFLFILFIILTNIWYLYFVINFFFIYNELEINLLSFSPYTVIFLFDLLLTFSSLFIIPYGFLKQINWTRIFALILLIESSIGAILYIISTKEIIPRYPLFNIYVIFIMYLLMTPANTYFNKKSHEISLQKIRKPYKFGEYTLYSKIVKLKSGKLQIIYFFSKKNPKSGTLINLPPGYKVYVNKRSNMPYLKKKG
jgi:hypothetical protein